jgi:hypothetical protein
MTTNSEAVTLGAQTSAEDNRTMTHVLELRKLLARHCTGPYSSEIAQFALVLRIGGGMQQFDEGCERIRRNRNTRYISVDLGFPSIRWKGASDTQIREFLVEAVETGLLCCLRRLEKDKTEVDASSLLRDFATAKRTFLSVLQGNQGSNPIPPLVPPQR